MYVDYLHYIAKGKILTPSMVGKMTKSFCDSYDAIITPTAKVRHHLEEQGIHKLMYTVPTGTDISSFAPVEKQRILDLKKLLGIGENDPVILSLGRIAHEKISMRLLMQCQKSFKQNNSQIGYCWRWPCA